MQILITLEVQVPDDVSPRQVVDEIVSNLESCDWVVVSTFYEVIPEQ